jgi:hypothetical protein
MADLTGSSGGGGAPFSYCNNCVTITDGLLAPVGLKQSSQPAAPDRGHPSGAFVVVVLCGERPVLKHFWLDSVDKVCFGNEGTFPEALAAYKRSITDYARRRFFHDIRYSQSCGGAGSRG